MSNSGQTVAEARAALQAYREQAAAIISMIPECRTLVGRAGDQAHEAAKNLKAAVTSYYKRPARSRQSMSQIESNFFAPRMDKVFVHLQGLHAGTNPGPIWRSALYDADIEIGHWLGLLDQK
jgi:alkanesulfonate monooxygenase SsuD/methylene tetrahydromethanopterin reductase-like flavin-dependent oxidoreductase (luciferase family)